MRKKDKFIFYLGGISSPYLSLLIWIISGLFVLSIPNDLVILIIIFIVFPILGFRYIRQVHRYQLRKYIRDLDQSSKDKISSLAKNWWNLHIAILIITLLVRIGIGRGNDPSVSAVKNGLVNGIKECLVRDIDNKTTNFLDAQSFSGNYSKFKIESLDPNSCYRAKAVPKTNQKTWFEIDFDKNTGVATRTCGDASKFGCEEGNTW